MSSVDAIAPGVYVAPPSLSLHRFGLFSVANMISSPEARWEAGVQWEPLAAGRAGTLGFVCDTAGAAGWPIEPREGEDVAEAGALIVFGSYSCGVGSRSMDEAEDRAIEHLLAGEERAVEYAIATGAADNAPSFQGATDLTPAGGAVDLDDGLGLLESYLGANHHSVGVIHAPRLLAPKAQSGMVSRQGQRLETLVGTFVAFGAGYDLAAVGPDGNPPSEGEAWVYGTARPQVRRGEVWTQPTTEALFAHRTNDLVTLALRTYVVGWDPVTVAVRVNAPG